MSNNFEEVNERVRSVLKDELEPVNKRLDKIDQNLHDIVSDLM
jgi:tetrahydromethanopterin S-methyltransferase subunit G